MKLVAGLGNPGARYRDTRHNVGFRVMDELARRESITFESAPAEALVARWRLGAEPVLLVKPLTMMNLSGGAVAALARYYKVEVGDLLVVADDVSLPLGRLRARARGSAGGHNGFKSIRQHLGTDAFARLRVGVGRGDARRDLADHVLATFAADERQVIEDAIAAAADAVVMFVAEGIEPVMNRFNAPQAPDERSEESTLESTRSEDSTEREKDSQQ
ncbi:MAG TPA: aminoacyl-tRNA hydrolase [Vicinamibacterales bacterium]|nr:aminoacyl-tRNA hydrolase [Vicinamibacterales bacterium]